MIGIDRKTVAKYWDEFKETMEAMKNPNIDIKLLQESIASPPSYASATRKGEKYTREYNELLIDEANHLALNHKGFLVLTLEREMLKRKENGINRRISPDDILLSPKLLRRR